MIKIQNPGRAGGTDSSSESGTPARRFPGRTGGTAMPDAPAELLSIFSPDLITFLPAILTLGESCPTIMRPTGELPLSSRPNHRTR